MSDEIIEELWRAKDTIALEHGNDVRQLAAYLQTRDSGQHRSASHTRPANERAKPKTSVESRTTTPG